MKLTQLQYFAAVAMLENMSKTAELLHISQPCLSKNIAALEEELGTVLLNRNAKRLTLTPAGKRFLQSCNVILQEYQEAEHDISFLRTGIDTRIRIASCGSIEKLYACMAAFQKRCPEVEYDMVNFSAGQHIDPDGYDVLIYPTEPQYARFQGYPLGIDHYLLAVHQNHPLAKKSALNLKMLNKLNFVFLSSNKSITNLPCNLYTTLITQSGTQSVVDTREMHREMIASGIAAGFVPESCAAFYASDSIRLLPIIDQKFSRELRICFPDAHSSLGQRFQDFTISYFSLTTQTKGD